MGKALPFGSENYLLKPFSCIDPPRRLFRKTLALNGRALRLWLSSPLLHAALLLGQALPLGGQDYLLKSLSCLGSPRRLFHKTLALCREGCVVDSLLLFCTACCFFREPLLLSS